MSNTAFPRQALSRRTWVGLVLADVVLFVLANVTATRTAAIPAP